ncbi:MAG: hypothetical protein ACOZDY_06350 [Pseudomonadota bacterium]
MPIDLEKLMNLDLSYPGFSFGYESWALDSYLKVLDDHLAFAQDQYRLRARRELESREGDLHPDQYGSELTAIDEAAEIQIPRFFRIGALVPIWGLFESFVSDIAGWVGRREGLGLPLRDVRANNFRSQIEKYFEGVLHIDLPWTPEERERLRCLQELRNFIAHRNGRLMDLPPDKEKEIRDLVAKINGVTIECRAVVVSGAYISEACALVFKLVSSLSKLIAERYDGPTVPRTET